MHLTCRAPNSPEEEEEEEDSVYEGAHTPYPSLSVFTGIDVYLWRSHFVTGGTTITGM